jgi:hypothetical protein
VLGEHERYRSACPDWLTRLARRTTVHLAAHLAALRGAAALERTSYR